jgi:iron complex transport system substrate-binding protein
VARLARKNVVIANLHPTRLADIWADIQRVADAIDRSDAGRDVVRDLEARVDRIAARARGAARRPTVLSIEWIDPVMIGGMWMPELIALAGGEPLVTTPGQHAPTLAAPQLEALDPEVIVVKPCGFDRERTLAQRSILRETLPWSAWGARRVYVADGNAYFNRPGRRACTPRPRRPRREAPRGLRRADTRPARRMNGAGRGRPRPAQSPLERKRRRRCLT